MKTYNVFRLGENGTGPSWLKGDEDLETAKLEAMRLSTETNKIHYVFDLTSSTVIYRTDAPLLQPPR